MADDATRNRKRMSMTDPTIQGPRRTESRRWLDRWMAALRTIGNLQAWILFTLFYLVILTPIALVFRFVADPLRLRRRGSTWQPLGRQYDRMDQALEQS